MDSTVKPDKVKVTLASERRPPRIRGGRNRRLHRGFQTHGHPGGRRREDKQFQVAAGGTITARYSDAENNRPGVPYERVAIIAHAAYAPPVIRLAHARVSRSTRRTRRRRKRSPRALNARVLRHMRAPRPPRSGDPRWQIDYSLLDGKSAPEGGFATVMATRCSLRWSRRTSPSV